MGSIKYKLEIIGILAVVFLILVIIILLTRTEQFDGSSITNAMGVGSRVANGALPEPILNGTTDTRPKDQLSVEYNNTVLPNVQMLSSDPATLGQSSAGADSGSFIESERELLRSTLNKLVVNDLVFAKPLNNTGATSAQFDAGEDKFIVNRFLERLNEVLKTNNRNYDLIQILDSSKTTNVGTQLNQYSFDIFILEINNYFSQEISVALTYPINGTTTYNSSRSTPIKVINATILSYDYSSTPQDTYFIATGHSDISLNNNGSLEDIEAPLLTQDQIDTEAKRRGIPINGVGGITPVSDYMCFGIANFQNYNSRASCESAGGKWDTPVKSSYECPFYKANKNWTNEFGGVNAGGYCDVPAGVKLIGYRYTSDLSTNAPLCYNCRDPTDPTKVSMGPCCDEQANNRTLYPTMSSPDYKYAGDLPERLKSPELRTRNLV